MGRPRSTRSRYFEGAGDVEKKVVGTESRNQQPSPEYDVSCQRR
jgi:hypothetical protein